MQCSFMLMMSFFPSRLVDEEIIRVYNIFISFVREKTISILRNEGNSYSKEFDLFETIARHQLNSINGLKQLVVNVAIHQQRREHVHG